MNKFPKEYISLLKLYKGNFVDFVNNYDIFNKFLSLSNIDESKFIQYAFASNIDWLNIIIYIYDNNKIEDFIKVKDYLMKYYYYNKKSDVQIIKSFISILNNYSLYNELLEEISNLNRELNNDEIDSLNYLFDSNIRNIKTKTLNDLKNYRNNVKNSYLVLLENIEYIDTNSIKEVLCNLLFNMNIDTIKNKITLYGSSSYLKKIKDRNINNKNFINHINNLIEYVSLMEKIIKIENKNSLINTIKYILDNFNEFSSVSYNYYEFDYKMHKLYEHELMLNLTKLNYIKNIDNFIDKNDSSKYNVITYDFSNTNYCLLVHSTSKNENIEDLIYGNANGNSNFICLSAISYLNIVLYSNKGIIFGYDSIPYNNYICSSIEDMKSNDYLTNNTIEFSNINRFQRSLLDLSKACNGHNSEVLCYRENLLAKYIILVDRKPTKEEIFIAKKYGLSFIKTQGINSKIKNPKNIESNYIDEYRVKDESLNPIIKKI